MKLKGNISILVIFVLLASSLLGVLAMNFVQSMMKQSATIYNYYQSYYLAKAGVELGLAELGHRGIGFEQTFADSGFVDENFLCAGRCAMTFGLSGTSTVLSQQFRTESGCQSPFLLSGGASLIVPVFKDISDFGMYDAFTSIINYANLYNVLRNANIESSDINQGITFGMLVLSGNELAQDGMFFRTGALSEMGNFLDAFESYVASRIPTPTNAGIPYQLFFMISNSSQQDISLCIMAQEPLPTQQYYLKSQGVYNRQKLGLEAIYKQPIPDFLFNAYASY